MKADIASEITSATLVDDVALPAVRDLLACAVYSSLVLQTNPGSNTTHSSFSSTLSLKFWLLRSVPVACSSLAARCIPVAPEESCVPGGPSAGSLNHGNRSGSMSIIRYTGCRGRNGTRRVSRARIRISLENALVPLMMRLGAIMSGGPWPLSGVA